MGRIEADIALESWLFGFRPCSALFVHLGSGNQRKMLAQKPSNLLNVTPFYDTYYEI